MINNLKIRTKLLLAFSLIIIAALVSITVNIFLLNNLNRLESNIFNTIDPAVNAGYDIVVSFNADIRAVEEYGNGYSTLDETEEIVEPAEAKIKSDIDKIEATGLVPAEYISSLRNILEKDEIQDEKVFDLKKSTESASPQGIISPDVRQALIDFDEVTDETDKVVHKVIRHLEQHKIEQVKELENLVNRSKLYITLASAVLMLISLLIGLIVVLKLPWSIKIIRDKALKLSEGDFSQRVPVKSKDEIGELSSAFNQMADNISKSQEELGKFKLAIENSSDQVVITDKDGKIIYANKTTEELTGYSMEEIIGNNPRLWGGQMPKEFYEVMWNTIKNKKQPFEGRLVNKNKNSQSYPVESKIYPVVDTDGDITFFIAVERDISSEKKIEENLAEFEKNNTFLKESQKALANVLEDQKTLEEELKQEKASVEQKIIERTKELSEEKIKLSASIASLTVGFIMTDRNNNIVTINQTARNILCASSTSPLATIKECTLAHVEDELKGIIDLRSLINKSVLEKKTLLIKEMTFQNRFLKIVVTPILEEAEAMGSVILVDDITEAKILERSRDEFFSIASHELRTPLTAIKGNSSMIEQFYGDKIKDPELKDMIADIHESSDRLIQIVNDFLDTSRLEQGRMDFKKNAVDLVQLIPDVIKEYQVTGSRKKLAIEYHQDEKVVIPQVFADSGKVKQVLINLIGNGLKFTEQGGITITTQILEGFVKVMVTDTGRGISKENQNLLFHKFQQANTSLLTRDTTKGTGLGLYISKLIIEGMGGVIKIESSVEGKGTTFSFTLPIITKEQLATPATGPSIAKIDSLTGLTKQDDK